MRHFISLPNGSIQFIKRGIPPDEIPGFEVDPGDSYLFHPVLPPCAARTYVTIEGDCCPISRHMRHCTKYGFYQMTPLQCKTCYAEGKSIPIELGIEKLVS